MYKLKNISKRIIISFFIIIFFVLISELIVRYETFGKYGFLNEKLESIQPFHNTEFVYNDSQNCGILKGLIPNKKGILNGAPFEINSLGFRDKEYSLIKKNGKFLLLNQKKYIFLSKKEIQHCPKKKSKKRF